jgi:hypothetical protein
MMKIYFRIGRLLIWSAIILFLSLGACVGAMFISCEIKENPPQVPTLSDSLLISRESYRSGFVAERYQSSLSYDQVTAFFAAERNVITAVRELFVQERQRSMATTRFT